uniref:Uncharacterized protein n=1 Tax=Arundo donax TaxID=35708 RepID=A0A0A8ZY31_ARUDO
MYTPVHIVMLPSLNNTSTHGHH